jgi:hypothetical protein
MKFDEFLFSRIHFFSINDLSLLVTPDASTIDVNSS